MTNVMRPGSPFTAWVVGMTILFVVVEFVNPAIWYSADVLGTARIIAATGGAAAAGIVGAILGAVIGVVAAMMWARQAPPADRKAASRALAAAHKRNGYVVLGCIVASAAFAAFNLTFTSEKASFVACTTIQSDLAAAQSALTGAPNTTIKQVNDALGRTKGCSGSYGGPLVTGALYYLRGLAYFLIDLLPDRANADFNRALPLIKDCPTRYAGTDKATMCKTYLAGVEAAQTQHYCDDALNLANRADNELYSDPGSSRADAQRGIASAAKCKSPYNWAYRGIALAQVGQAQVKLGVSAATSLTESQHLLARCIAGLGGRLLRECKAAQKVVAQARSGRTGV